MSEALSEARKRLSADPFDAATPAMAIALVREAVMRLGWGTMVYKCSECGFEWRVWLSLGVEGPAALRSHGLFVASPFMLGGCPSWPQMQVCGGHMSHVRFGEDEEFEPRLIPDDAPRLVVPYSAFRGDSGARLEVPEPALVAARRAGND